MDRETKTWTSHFTRAGIMVVAILVGTYVLLLIGKHIRIGCFGFQASCPGNPVTPEGIDAMEDCVSAQYALACPLWMRAGWLVVWALYCFGVVGLVMQRELRARFGRWFGA